MYKSKGMKSITTEMILDACLKLIVNEALPLSKIESQHGWDFVHSTYHMENALILDNQFLKFCDALI